MKLHGGSQPTEVGSYAFDQYVFKGNRRPAANSDKDGPQEAPIGSRRPSTSAAGMSHAMPSSSGNGVTDYFQRRNMRGTKPKQSLYSGAGNTLISNSFNAHSRLSDYVPAQPVADDDEGPMMGKT